MSGNLEATMTTTIYHRYTIALLALLLVGCAWNGAVFSKKELREELNTASAEEQFARDNFMEPNCLLWEQGKPFVYTDRELTMLLSPIEGGVEADHSYQGQRFTFHSIQEQDMYGSPEASLVFESQERLYRHKTNKSLAELEQMSYTPFIPHLISLDLIAHAREVLVGKTLYLKSSLWYSPEGEEIEGRKLVPVTITDVQHGTEVLPAKVYFTDSRGVEATVLMRLSATASTGQYLSFDRLFSFDNPRNTYPETTDTHWQLITASQVAEGMTKQECKLAIGSPDRVKQIPTYGGLKEQWFYNTGTYCLFEDGLLSSFR